MTAKLSFLRYLVSVFLTSLSYLSLQNISLVVALTYLASCEADNKHTRHDQLKLIESNHKSLTLEPAFPNLIFSKPVEIKEPPGNPELLYVAEQDGRLLSFSNEKSTKHTKTVIDISAKVLSRGEQGLLSFAFDPNFDSNGYIYLHYSEKPKGDTVISRFFIDPRSGIVDVRTEIRIFTHQQPYTNHNGGAILFGPDNYLYIGLGDGGSAGDPQRNAQNLGSLLGKILRIDVSRSSGDSPYAIPNDNPFALDQLNGRPEIFAFGLRNPWRMNFDPATQYLWVGDVGQNSKEEIDIVAKGGNYGWNVIEGFGCYPPSIKDCDKDRFTPPIFEYPRSDGQSVTGGIVYRANKLISLKGKYIFGDFMSGRIWALDADSIVGGNDKETSKADLIIDSKLNISSFGSSSKEELYVVSYYNGLIYRFIE